MLSEAANGPNQSTRQCKRSIVTPRERGVWKNDGGRIESESNAKWPKSYVYKVGHVPLGQNLTPRLKYEEREVVSPKPQR